MPKILVVDDDRHIRELIAFALRKEGFAVVEAGDGLAALEAAARAAPDLVILDILMPELDGDDYVTKPFSPRELVARVKAVLRRPHAPASTAASEGPRELRHGALTLDLDAFIAAWDGAAVPLTV